MKILIVGADQIFSIENFYVRYLLERHIEVKRFTPKNIFYSYYNKGLVNKLLFRVGLSGIYKEINHQLKQFIEKENPTVLWVFKGMEVLPSTLVWAKSRGIKLANYNPDNPFVFTGRGSGNSNITNSIELYDLHFTYNLAIKDQLEREHHAKTAFLPFGYDLSDELFALCAKEPEVISACFLGNPDKIRATFIHTLADTGIKFDVYGHDWANFINHKNVTLCNAVYGDDQWRVLRKYRVQLNLMRIHNEDSHNMRTFEVPGVGGIMVAPDTREHRLFYEAGKEAFLFSDAAECARHINYLLNLTEAEALVIRECAHKRCLASGYRYIDRTSQVLESLTLLQRA